MNHINFCYLSLLLLVLNYFQVLGKKATSQTFIVERSLDDGLPSAKEDSRPNIILIMADDMGWGDVGANWHPTTATPRLDSLARQGLRFTDFHSGASVCTPSRGSLLTGRLGLRTGIYQNFDTGALGGIPINETTIAEVLRDSGYKTAMLGKWHLGMQPGHHPLDKGFNSYLGIPYSTDMGCNDDPGFDHPACGTCPHAYEDNVTIEETCNVELAIPLVSNNTIIHQPVDLEKLSHLYASFAEKFMENSASPYFLYAALSHMHVPLAHAPEFTNVTGKGVYADTLAEMDWLVGRIRDVAYGLDNNTLLWFITDNGPWDTKCQYAGVTGPYTGVWQADFKRGGGGGTGKFSVWEGGHRVPSILVWPGHTEPGRVTEALSSALDIFPTFASLTKVGLPPDRFYDGKDLSDVIDGKSDFGHETLFHPNSGGFGPIGTIGAVRWNNYKVVYYSGGVIDCLGNWGPPIDHRDAPLAFDLSLDPEEGSPLEFGTKLYYEITSNAQKRLGTLLDSVKADNTSTVDYGTSFAARPCCDVKNVICRCSWD